MFTVIFCTFLLSIYTAVFLAILQLTWPFFVYAAVIALMVLPVSQLQLPLIATVLHLSPHITNTHTHLPFAGPCVSHAVHTGKWNSPSEPEGWQAGRSAIVYWFSGLVYANLLLASHPWRQTIKAMFHTSLLEGARFYSNFFTLRHSSILVWKMAFSGFVTQPVGPSMCSIIWSLHPITPSPSQSTG